MKKLICITCALAFASISYANIYLTNGYNDQIRKDYCDESGRHQGYSKLQPYSNQTDHYDKWGQRQGYSKKDPFTGEIRHYNQWGQYEGSTR